MQAVSGSEEGAGHAVARVLHALPAAWASVGGQKSKTQKNSQGRPRASATRARCSEWLMMARAVWNGPAHVLQARGCAWRQHRARGEKRPRGNHSAPWRKRARRRCWELAVLLHGTLLCRRGGAFAGVSGSSLSTAEEAALRLPWSAALLCCERRTADQSEELSDNDRRRAEEARGVKCSCRESVVSARSEGQRTALERADKAFSALRTRNEASRTLDRVSRRLPSKSAAPRPTPRPLI